jgi:hypothetical protein
MTQAALARVRAPVGIPQDEPKNAVAAEHAANFTEDLDQCRDISLWRCFESDLTLAALIIAQLKIGRAGYYALDRLIAQWNSSRIATNDHRLPSRFGRPLAKSEGAFSRPLRAARRLRKKQRRQIS